MKPTHILFENLPVSRSRERKKRNKSVLLPPIVDTEPNLWYSSELSYIYLPVFNLFQVFIWLITIMYTNINYKPFASQVSLVKSKSSDNFYRKAAQHSLKNNHTIQTAES